MKEEDLENEESNVFNLILKLRQEKLFVTNEKYGIQKLNEQIGNKINKVTKSAWITTKQRLLISERDIASQNCHKIDALNNCVFVKAKDALGFQTAVKIGSLLQLIRSQPKDIANWLITCEKTVNDTFLLQSIVSGLYTFCLFPKDTNYLLILLNELAKIEFLKCENPHRTIKQRNCFFKNLYFLFNDVLYCAKFFLNATFQMPILQLMADDFYLDMDPDKSVMRFNQIQNSTMFKTPHDYRNGVVTKLAKFTNNFISSMLENIYSFPKSIAWIVHQVSKIIEKSFDAKEANAVATELIFTLYICPIILDPEQFGLCNIQITDVSRHNLIQVGQILQSLALSKFEPIDIKYMDLFDLLDKERFSNFFEMLFYDIDDDNEPPVEMIPDLNRRLFLFTEQELNCFMAFLQKIHLEESENDHFGKEIAGTIEEQLATFFSTSVNDQSPKSNRPSPTEVTENTSRKLNFFNLGTKNHIQKSPDDSKPASNVVLVFPLDEPMQEPIGLLPEQKVLNMQQMIPKSEDLFIPITSKITVNLQDPVTQNGQIKPSYSNFPDEGSVGNTSDNLEAISEAASNHSVASSLELENEDQNDNLSDMVSANVSGRGTPNISGRDTPSSQVNENDDRVAEARQADISQSQPQISRQIRSEIDDKFCKFEIKKLLEGDETISIISETWSTDVLASDNEAVDAGESRPSLHLVDQAIHEVPISNILDLSETQSESAWSTDVMASDTERLTEVDNDDSGSVAQSDDTNSVARSDEVRSEIDDNVELRRLSSVSNSQLNSISNNSNYNNCSNSFEEYRKVEMKNGKIYNPEQLATHIDNNANNTVFKSLTLSDSQHITYSEHTGLKTFNKNVTIVTNRVHNSNLCKENDVNIAGPSGLNKRMNSLETEPDSGIYLKHRMSKKLDDRPNEILLSNCSLNSSSSGSSSNSFENKNSHNENSEQWTNKQWLNSSGSSLNVTLTPSESTSELSVLSVNNLNDPSSSGGGGIVNILSKKSATPMGNRSMKFSSTGAIPKSISFDMTADKGLDDEHRSKRSGGSGGSFFGKLRMGFRNRRGNKSFRNHEEYMDNYDEVGKKSLSESPIKVNNNNNNIETSSDDILAKYRSKPFVETSPSKENSDVTKSKQTIIGSDSSSSNNSEVNSFIDIKKKLRLVLSNTSEIPHYIKTTRLTVKNKIETVLLLELGKARKLKDWSNVARISEALRCITLLNANSCLKLIQSLKEDILLRSTYIQYLICSKQELLFCDNHLNSLQEQISHEKDQCERYLTTLCVQEILSEHDEVICRLVEENRGLRLVDEKCDQLESIYDRLFSILGRSDLWHKILHTKEKDIEVILERIVMSKVYINSFNPNGDVDRGRDSILREHIEKLSRIISPNHKDLRIPKMYLRECPWLPAQDALRGLNACITPRDKINCVVHCAKSIMDLLSMSQTNGSTAADDFTPVLVYVIVKVNPEELLSNIQFVNNFLRNRLSGEDQYWWTQFCAAVEYIKTMDYSD